MSARSNQAKHRHRPAAGRADPRPRRSDDVLVLAPGRPTAGIEVVGGKAENLGIMLDAGLPVPTTAVVTTDAFRRIVDLPAIAAMRDELASGVELADDEIDARFLDIDLPDDLRRSIVRARQRVAPRTPVAIRSSATTEDLADASFAGQYASFLDVDTDDDVVDAVLRVWASLWHRAPRLYRKLHGLDDQSAAMAVIVQEMVPAVRAGVVFTIDPDDQLDRLRVEHVSGLGEGLVSGAITPTAVVAPRDRLLDLPAEVREAAELAMQAEAVFSGPQDVEWADDGRRVVVVQSRPITTSITAERDDGFDTAVHPHRRHTTAGIAEMLPGVLPALVWSTAGFMVEEAFRHSMDRLGALPGTLVASDGFVVRLRGRAALDLGHLGDVADGLPGGSAAELEQQYFGTSSLASPRPSTDVSWRERLRHDLRVLASSRHARRDQAVTTIAVDAVVAEPLALGRLDDRELLALRSRLVDLGVRTAAAEFNVAAAAAAAFRRLEDTLAGHLGATAGSTWARRVTRGSRSAPLMETAEQLGRLLARMPGIGDHDTWEAASVALGRLGHHSVVASIDDARRRAGCQRVIGGRTWDEQPDRYWHLVRDAGRRSTAPSLQDDLRDLERTLVQLPGWTRRRIVTGQIVDIRRQLVRRLVRNAVDLLERREVAKGGLLSLGGPIRRLDLEIGERLTERGALLRPDDVVHLHPTELRDALRRDAAVGLDELLRRRHCIERWESDVELPLTFTGRPPAAEPEAPPGDRLDGWGASGGRHAGRVRYLTEPDETQVEPGDVVVAVRTDAAWSPVFVRASAIVVEQGGPLSHAAIVAREFGLPAVVNVPGAVARLRDEAGDVIVDGDLGAVFVVRSDAAPADDLVGTQQEAGG